MRYPTEALAALCRQLGSNLTTLPAGLDGAKLLWALAGNESSFGENMAPRHEAGYCYGGRYFSKPNTDQWGCLAHCSYGPWQVMYANYPPGLSPGQLMYGTDEAARLCLLSAIQRIKHALVEGAASLEDIGLGYNAGTIRAIPQPRHLDYQARLRTNYGFAMPAVVPAQATLEEIAK